MTNTAPGLDAEPLKQLAQHLVNDHTRLLRALVARRLEQGISQTLVADRMGVARSTVMAIERCDADPTLSTLRRYALAIGARIQTRVVED